MMNCAYVELKKKKELLWNEFEHDRQLNGTTAERSVAGRPLRILSFGANRLPPSTFLLPGEPFTFVFGEVSLAKPNNLRRHFDIFVPLDVFQGRFQRHLTRWLQHDRVIGT